MKNNEKDLTSLKNYINGKSNVIKINSNEGFHLVQKYIIGNCIDIFPNLLNICTSDNCKYILSMALGKILSLCHEENLEISEINKLSQNSRFKFIITLIEHGAELKDAIHFEYHCNLTPNSVLEGTTLTTLEKNNVLLQKQTKSLVLFTASLLSEGLFYHHPNIKFKTKSSLKYNIPWFIMLKILGFIEDFECSEDYNFMPLKILNILNFINQAFNDEDANEFEKRLAQSYICNNY